MGTQLSVPVNRDNRLHAFAVGRTLSLLVALACLSTPELARQLAGGRGVWAGGEGKMLARTGHAPAAKMLGAVLRAPGSCLKLARNSTLRALHQWALAEAAADCWAPVPERIATVQADAAVSASGPPSYSLFSRPPPVRLHVTV